MNLFTRKRLALPSFCDSRTPALPLALDAPASASQGRRLHRCGHRRASTPDLKPQVWANPRWATAGAQGARKDGESHSSCRGRRGAPGQEVLSALVLEALSSSDFWLCPWFFPPGLPGPQFRDWGSSMFSSPLSRSSSRYCPVNTSHDALSYHYLVFPSLS